jgi:hypothetical protein
VVREAKRVTLSSAEELLGVIEDVRNDSVPRIVERRGEGLAAVISVGDLDKVLAPEPTSREIEAAFKAAGSWSDVDTASLKRSISEGRRSGSRPASRPA